MQTVPASLLHPVTRTRSRTAVVASADRNFRQRLSEILTGLRWQVREAEGGAQAWAEAESSQPEAVIVDSWLPDLELSEFVADFRLKFPQVDLVSASGSIEQESPRGPYRQELLYALRRSQDTDTAAWNTAPALTRGQAVSAVPSVIRAGAWPGALPGVGAAGSEITTPRLMGGNGAGSPATADGREPAATGIVTLEGAQAERVALSAGAAFRAEAAGVGSVAGFGPGVSEVLPIELRGVDRLPEMIGNAACMLEVSRRIRLVAPRLTPVLIEGPTGSGKELVAEALHRLSPRNRKPFVAINCAAIPEALLEAELFGHTRGAFTGAVQGRVGRIESADGGTLFLDEIGEMPLALQSKLLRFVESSELQRVGDNESIKVDVRIVAATHRPLADHAKTGTFRADLYYRLAVFLIRTPALLEHTQDLPVLVDHFLQRLGRDAPMKRLDEGAMGKLAAHTWPGNVRELEHVLERAAILAGDEAVLTSREIDFGFSVN